ncbi:MAG TPA: hypothetical protein VGQ76_09475 [Thermoanaerobaculia bacterium]|jgi:hypothetical protein|nr:hypothetical protein [Thermoanaerobaculia bacterium]
MTRPNLQHEDPVLRAVMDAPSEADRHERIAQLLAETADPVIDGILRRTQIHSGFQREDIDDLRSSVHLRLLERLEATTERVPIQSFREFVAVTTYHAVDDLLRGRYPQRTQLKKRIRHLLSTHPSFAMSTEGRRVVAGLSEWDMTSPAAEPRLTEITNIMRDGTRPAEALRAVLAKHGKPVDLDALVTLMADLWGVAIGPQFDSEPTEITEDRERDALSQVETRQSLTMLWEEIKALPADQCVALLLNLRDGHRESAISLFVFSGVADLDELATSVGLSSAQLEDMWSELPLEDARIANLLGVTRQQVINLRKSARARLARRKLRGGF